MTFATLDTSQKSCASQIVFLAKSTYSGFACETRMAIYDTMSLKVIQNAAFVVNNSILNDKHCSLNGILLLKF